MALLILHAVLALLIRLALSSVLAPLVHLLFVLMLPLSAITNFMWSYYLLPLDLFPFSSFFVWICPLAQVVAVAVVVAVLIAIVVVVFVVVAFVVVAAAVAVFVAAEVALEGGFHFSSEIISQ